MTSRSNGGRLPPDRKSESAVFPNHMTIKAGGGVELRRIAFGLLLIGALAALAVGLGQKQWLTVHQFGSQI